MQYDVEQAPGYTYAHAPVPAYQPPQNLPPAAPAAPPGIDLGALIKEAVNTAVQQNKDALIASGQKAIAKAASGEKVSVKHAGSAADSSEVEDNFDFGPSSKRTLLQGLAVDLGFAAMAVLGTATAGGDFDITDAEQWTILGAMLVKTVLQTGMSYVMRLRVD
jgi:hypothetical protein